VISSFLGGFNTNGRNAGLEAIDSVIERSIKTQSANLANRKDMLERESNAIADQVARGKSMHDAQETVRLATYDAALSKLSTDVQQFDPRGAQAAKIMEAMGQISAARAAAAAKAQDQDFKQSLDFAKHSLDESKHLLEIEKANAEIAYKDAQTRKLGAGGKAKEIKFGDVPRTGAQLRQLGIPVEDSQVPPEGLSVNQAENVAKAGKASEDRIKAGRENSPEERNRQFAVGELVDVDGNSLQFRSVEGAEKVGTLKAAGDFMVQLTDRMDAAYQQHGWSSDLLKSPEWQEAQADLSQYILEKKNLDQLGVLAGPDLGLIQGSYGRLDITGVRDPGPGLRRARENTIEKVNSTVRAQAASGVKPRRWEPPKPRPPAPKSPQQESIQRVLTFNPKRMSSEETKELGGIGKTMSGAAPTIPPSYAAAIDRLVSVFNDSSKTEKEREEAGAHLDALKTSAKAGAIRDYAVKAASEGALRSVPLSDE
jgi:hypothetical protein